MTWSLESATRCVSSAASPVSSALNAHPQKRPASLKYLIISLASLITIAVVIGIFAARSYTGTPFRIQGVQHLTMDHVFNGTFSAHRSDVHWVPEGVSPLRCCTSRMSACLELYEPPVMDVRPYARARYTSSPCPTIEFGYEPWAPSCPSRISLGQTIASVHEFLHTRVGDGHV